MAYNANNEERVELTRIKKNERGENIVVTQITNKNSGNMSIDIRQYYTNDEGELCPTAKGVRFSAELLNEFVQGIVKGLEIDEAQDVMDVLAAIVDGEDSAEADTE